MTDTDAPTRRFAVPLTAPQPTAATSGLLWEPPRPAPAAVVLGHGAGSTMTAPVLAAVATALVRSGYAVAVFNFPYAELGRRGPDPMPRLQSAFRDAVEVVRQSVPGVPLVVGGRSMGGRVGSMLVADGLDAAGVLLLGYPLHPAGRPERLRVDHWPRLAVPVLFVSGTRDSLFGVDLFEAHRGRIAGAVTLHLLDGADHGFHVRSSGARTDAEVLDEVCDVSVGWVHQLVAG